MPKYRSDLAAEEPSTSPQPEGTTATAPGGEDDETVPLVSVNFFVRDEPWSDRLAAINEHLSRAEDGECDQQVDESDLNIIYVCGDFSSHERPTVDGGVEGVIVSWGDTVTAEDADYFAGTVIELMALLPPRPSTTRTIWPERSENPWASCRRPSPTSRAARAC